MRTRESAARAALGLLCKEFRAKYQQSEIIRATATAVSLPFSLTERCANSPSFLLGAALWLLDYVEREELWEELIPLLPPEL